MNDRSERLRRKAILCLLSGALISVILGVMIFQGAAVGRPTAGMAVLVALGALMVVLVAIGVNLLLAARQAQSGEQLAPSSYRHTYPLFALLGILVLAASVARALLVPETFGEDGFFRSAAPAEIASAEPRHLGQEACAPCHDTEAEAHNKDVHASVQCETCHGPAAEHVAEDGKSPLLLPKGKDYCLECHRLLLARPSFFPQVVWQEHYQFIGVADTSIDCNRCHDPHQPLFMDRDLRQARLHPVIHRCKDCHIGRTDDTLKRPEGHPAIFTCDYCHQDLVQDFANRPHHKLPCTTCHTFIKESDFAGRIVRDADPRFCLLCHRKAEFRSEQAPPSIEWPEHLDEVGNGPEDAGKKCIDCHRDSIHKIKGQSDGP